MLAAFWVEGVDFESTVDDTSDLSTIRGASLALNRFGHDLRLALKAREDDQFSVEPVFGGAAQTAFFLHGTRERVTAEIARSMSILGQGRDVEAIRRDAAVALRTATRPAIAPYAFLSFVHGLHWCESADEPSKANALERAKAAGRLMQMRQFSVGDWRGASATSGPCAIDRLRPADETIQVNADRAGERAHDESTTGSVSLAVCSAVAARRHFGRAQRQAFYRETLPAETVATWRLADPENRRLFADSLHDLIADPPSGLPLSLTGKIGVFYADGNAFSEIRASLGGGPSGQRKFSEHLGMLMSSRLLPALLQPFLGAHLDRSSATKPWVATPPDGQPRVRFETLMWGGDEVCFVMPSWLALDFAARFFEIVATDEWRVGPAHDQRLTFSAGLLIASYKTPIRSSRRFVSGLADMAKGSGERLRNKLSVEVLEGLEIQADDAMATRRATLGFGSGRGEDFVLDAGHLTNTLGRIAALKADNGLPRSQLSRWLQIAVQDRAFDDPDSARQVRLVKDVQRYLSHAGAEHALDIGDLKPEPDHPRTLATSLYLASLLWDYVKPLDASESDA